MMVFAFVASTWGLLVPLTELGKMLPLLGSMALLPSPCVQASDQANRKDTAAAERTRRTLATVKVSGRFTEARLGDILKEFAQQVEERIGEPVLWTYGPGFPAGLRLSLEIKEQPLEQALDVVLNAASKLSRQELGYIVLSLPDDKYDGWIRLTTSGERGREHPPATPEEQHQAQERLELARKLLAEGKTTAARLHLQVILKKYPSTAAAREARILLEKLGS
ncbi:MAG: hypothetical protein RMJ88_06555 [Thermogemmata sp.]|nr:hypothetical protein [Thermogemmata sp.]